MDSTCSDRQRASRRRGNIVFLGLCLFSFVGYGLIVNCFGMFLSPGCLWPTLCAPCAGCWVPWRQAGSC